MFWVLENHLQHPSIQMPRNPYEITSKHRTRGAHHSNAIPKADAGLAEIYENRVGPEFKKNPGDPIYVDPIQIVSKPFHRGFNEQQLRSADTSVFGGRETIISESITKSAFGSVKDIGIIIEVLISTASVTLLPAEFFFNRIRIMTANGSGGDMVYITPESTWFDMAFLDYEKRHAMGIEANHTADMKPSGRTFYAGQIARFHIPLWRMINFKGGLPFDHMNSDLQIEFTARATIVESGSGTATLQNMTLSVIEDVYHDAYFAAQRNAFLESNVISTRYLDVVETNKSGMTLTAGQYKDIDLDDFDKQRMAFVVVGVRESNYQTNAGYGPIRFLDLGLGSGLNIVNASGTPIWGVGPTTPGDYIKYVRMAASLPGDFGVHTNMYMLDFTESPAMAIQGVSNGFMDFERKFKLRLTPGTAGTAEVQTITCTNAANDGGYYYLTHGGYTTTQLAFDANVAAIKAALEALPSFSKNDLHITASAALTTTITLTFTELGPQEPIGIVITSLNDGTVVEVPTMSISTPGVRGWNTGSTYVVTVIGYKYRDLSLGKGRFSIMDVTSGD